MRDLPAVHGCLRGYPGACTRSTGSQRALPPVVYGFHCFGKEQKDLTFLGASREVTK